MAQGLNQTQKTILTLYVKGKTRKETAEILGTNLNTINCSVSNMRERLEIERGIDLGQWLISRIPRDVLVKYI